MSLSDLSQGSVDQMVNHFDPNSKLDGPICQILSIKKIPPSNPGSAERYRVILSDGVHYCQSMLAMQMKHLVDNGTITRNCLVRVLDYASNHVQSRRILIILNVEKFTECEYRLGAPANLEGGAAKPDAGGAGQQPSESAKLAARPQPESTTNQKPSFSTSNYTRSNGSGVRNASTGVGGTKSKLPVYPIEALSPYQNKWTIRARVTYKGDIKHYSNARGEGKLFSVNLLDESGEIRATGFTETVDRFYNLLKENGVYYISKCKVVIAKKQFSTLNNEYELQFDNHTEIEECTDNVDVPSVSYNFVPLDQLEAIEPNQTCDVLGVVEKIGELGEIISRATQKPVAKRELTLVDSSGMSVRVTLWGKSAENFRTDEERPIIAFKGVKVGDFGGRSLSMHSGSTMHVNVETPEAYSLRGWYETEGAKSNFKSYLGGGAGASAGGGPAGSNLDERKTIFQVRDQELGMNDSDRPDFFNMRAMVVYIKADNLYYTACPSDNCNKKVNLDVDGWRCEKCDRSYEAPQHRYILTANVADHTGQIWISGFNDVGEELIGMTADQLDQLKQENESESAAVLKRVCGKSYLFNCRAKQDTFNDQVRVRYTVTKLAHTDFRKEGNLLADAISKLL
ncbi:replication factor-a protein [Tilletiaria anomala UBC 951]|uniref:Replication protein A subunit n=1 Tax=Tilletiaria anomala (strain ATCC 24038 / CBS 436.72 / UBC 951) TaxID=1037660 RepID=A0A066W8Y8_TILAU|nr:replication factor-a protein [Tilletiaria anomala UBC 951]KDN50412.1 replication factor-a protein [Tilletiaria anomala UBC 951]